VLMPLEPRGFRDINGLRCYGRVQRIPWLSGCCGTSRPSRRLRRFMSRAPTDKRSLCSKSMT
jgi:hypothetical protein